MNSEIIKKSEGVIQNCHCELARAVEQIRRHAHGQGKVNLSQMGF